MSGLSGWQRIDVVISVLWIIGLPTFLFIDTIRANEHGAACFRDFSELSWKLSREGKQAEAAEADRERDKCWNHQGHITPIQAFEPFIKGNIETVIVWAPVALLWILGGTIFATVRWIKRGFTS